MALAATGQLKQTQMISVLGDRAWPAVLSVAATVPMHISAYKIDFLVWFRAMDSYAVKPIAQGQEPAGPPCEPI